MRTLVFSAPFCVLWQPGKDAAGVKEGRTFDEGWLSSLAFYMVPQSNLGLALGKTLKQHPQTTLKHPNYDLMEATRPFNRRTLGAAGTKACQPCGPIFWLQGFRHPRLAPTARLRPEPKKRTCCHDLSSGFPLALEFGQN